LTALASSQNPFVIQCQTVVSTTRQSGIGMDKDTYSVPQSCGFDSSKLRKFLRDKHPHDTAKSVARALGMKSHRTVGNWLEGAACPGFFACGAMIAAWGPEFINAVMTTPPDWASEALAREELAELEQQSAALKAKLRSPE
jgi:hypothetical protein